MTNRTDRANRTKSKDRTNRKDRTDSTVKTYMIELGQKGRIGLIG